MLPAAVGLLIAVPGPAALAADAPLLLDYVGRERTVRLPDGRLAAVYVRPDGSAGAVYSWDEGRNWTAPQGTVHRWMVQAMLDNDGVIHGFYKEPRGSGAGSSTINIDHFLDTWYVKTDAVPLVAMDSASFGYRYEMDLDPGVVAQIDLDANGQRDFVGSPGVKNTGVAGSTDGYTIAINSTRPSPNQGYNSTGASSLWGGLDVDADSSFTAEVRLKVNSGQAHFSASANGPDAWLNIGTEGQAWGLLAQPMPLGAENNADAFHTFRFAYNGEHLWAWRDDEPLNLGHALPDGYAGSDVKRLVVGSLNEAIGNGVTEIDYIRFDHQGAYAPVAAARNVQQFGDGHAIHLGWEGGMIGQPLQMSSGRLVFPTQDWGAGVALGPPTGPSFVTSLYSDDGGETWTRSPSELRTPVPANVNMVGFGAVEPALLQLKDERLWMVMRTQTGKLYESFSTDGIAWSDPTPTRFHSSISPAQLIRMPDGRIVMFWCNAQVPDRVNNFIIQAGRDALHAAVSYDDGETWTGFREVLLYPYRNDSPPDAGIDFGVGYPYARLTEDGSKIHLFTGQYHRFGLLIDPDWLEEKARSDDFSDGLANWSTFKRVNPTENGRQDRIPGAVIVTDPAGSGDPVMHLRKNSFSQPADGATWNFPAGTEGSLVMPVMIRSGFSGGVVALTDRFFDPIDPNAESDAIFSFRLNANGRLGVNGDFIPFNEWVTLELRWSTQTGLLQVLADGEQALLVGMNETPVGGVSYVHLRSLASFLDNAGFMVKSVSVVVPEPALAWLPVAALLAFHRSTRYRRFTKF